MKNKKVFTGVIFLCLVFVILFLILSKPIMKNTENKFALLVESSAFKDNELMPAKFTCDGNGTNPPVKISNIPSEAKTLSLIMEDPDAPSGTFIHWVKWNIPVLSSSFEIKENEEPAGISGSGTIRNLKYIAPCPPSGIHRYIFNFYALDEAVDLKQGSQASDLMESMKNHILAEGKLIGLYKRN